ncbi:hypothetical protein V1478_002744 [Vespula squamosa]|uniref:Uncharacterized protein n=1 Tax=Vespula squamosa TaxID=30214 RepID=A0ABD2BT24_VESSQ
MPFVGSEQKTVTGRTCDVLKVNILNNEVKRGYIPALNLGDGIYAGEAIVTHSNGQTNIKVFNTNEEEVKIKIPTVLLEEFEVVNEHDVSSLGHDALVVNTRQLFPSGTCPRHVHLEDNDKHGNHQRARIASLRAREVSTQVTLPTPLLPSSKQIVPDIAYFTTVSGTPLDIGAKELADNGKLPAISEAMLGRVKVTKKNKRYYIALPVKERLSISTQLEISDEALHSLLDEALELQLKTIAISRSPVGDVPWANVKSKLRSIFSGS